MTFKAAWNADGLVIRVSNLDPGLSSLSVYGSTTDQQGELLKTVTDFDGKDSMDISVPLTGKAGSIVYLDLVAESNVTAYVQKRMALMKMFIFILYMHERHGLH